MNGNDITSYETQVLLRFSPRPHRGSDPMGWTLASAKVVSIHAPTERATV